MVSVNNHAKQKMTTKPTHIDTAIFDVQGVRAGSHDGAAMEIDNHVALESPNPEQNPEPHSVETKLGTAAIGELVLRPSLTTLARKAILAARLQ